MAAGSKNWGKKKEAGSEEMVVKEKDEEDGK